MTPFFDKFPRIAYDINKSGYTNFETITNIFFRIGVVRDALSDATSYYVYDIQDDDTPEIVAENVYGDAGAYWIILYANDIVDPQYDWPLNHHAFYNYIVDKYGSVANAKTTIHHYEKVIDRTNSAYNLTTETRFWVNGNSVTNNNLTVPYDTYNNLSLVQTVYVHNIGGTTIQEVSHGEAISCYDYEVQQNDNKRRIKVIKADYYSRIMSEFDKLTAKPVSYVRRVY